MSLSRIPSNGKVAVIGAGVSGLSYAYFLSKLRPDVRIKIFEQSSTAGGYIKSVTEKANGDSIVVEKGPRTLRGISDGSLLIVDMLRQMGKADIINVMERKSAANRKFLAGPEGQLIATPSGFGINTLKFLLGPLSDGLTGGILGEAFRRKGSASDESIEQFIKRRFGSTKIADNMLSAIYRGIYAGDVSSLSINSVMPSLKNLEIEHGSLVKGILNKMIRKKPTIPNRTLEFYQEKINPLADLGKLGINLKKYPMFRLSGGLQQFPLLLAKELSRNANVEINYNYDITQLDITNNTLNDGVDKFDHIRSTIPIPKLLEILKSENDLKSLLQKLPYVSIAMVNIYSKNTNLIPEPGFGFLVPKKLPNDNCLLGVIYDSDIETHVKPLFHNGATPLEDSDRYSKVTLMLGGYMYNTTAPPNMKMLHKIIKDVLATNLQVNVDAKKIVIFEEGEQRQTEGDIFYSVSFQDKCIPQYNVGYAELTQEVLGKLPKTFSLGGMAFGAGIGVPDCVRHSLESLME